MRLKKIVSNEKGSVTVEFIAILPFVFLIMLICWQFLVGVYGVIISQSAANEAAKVYAPALHFSIKGDISVFLLDI